MASQNRAVNVHSLPSAPTVPALIIICFHLLLLLSQILNEFTDSVTILLLSMAIDRAVLFHHCHLVPAPPALTVELSSERAQEVSPSPDLPMPESRNLRESTRDVLLVHSTVQSCKSSAVSRLSEVLKESEEDLTHDDETGPEHCAAQSRDQIHLPSKAALEIVRAAMPW